MGKNKEEKRDGRGRPQKFGNGKISREISSGGVVFRKIKGQTFWLITKSAPSKYYISVWRLPKGLIEENENDKTTALREVEEEAGVKAEIIEKVSTIKYIYNHYQKGKVFKIVIFYLMQWKSDLTQGYGYETSEVQWLVFNDAYQKLSFPAEKSVLKKAKVYLSQKNAIF